MLPFFSAEANLFDVITTAIATLCAVVGVPWGIFILDRHNQNKENELKIQYRRLPKYIQRIITKSVYSDDIDKFKENCLFEPDYYFYMSQQKRLLFKLKKGIIFYKYKLWINENNIWAYEKKWKCIFYISKDEILKNILNKN